MPSCNVPCISRVSSTTFLESRIVPILSRSSTVMSSSRSKAEGELHMSPEQICTLPQRHETLCRRYFRVEQSEEWDCVWETTAGVRRSSTAVRVSLKFMGATLHPFGIGIHDDCRNQAITPITPEMSSLRRQLMRYRPSKRCTRPGREHFAGPYTNPLRVGGKGNDHRCPYSSRTAQLFLVHRANRTASWWMRKYIGNNDEAVQKKDFLECDLHSVRGRRDAV